MTPALQATKSKHDRSYSSKLWRSFHRLGSKGFLRWVTVDLSGLLLRHFGGGEWMVLITRGRRTGKPHSVLLPCVLDPHEDTAYVVSTDGLVADWVKNIKNDDQVLITLMGQRVPGKAEIITDKKEMERIVIRYEGRWGPRPFFAILKLVKKDAIWWISDKPLVRIRLDRPLG